MSMTWAPDRDHPAVTRHGPGWRAPWRGYPVHRWRPGGSAGVGTPGV